jgi:diaminopimelate decarboxylase
MNISNTSIANMPNNIPASESVSPKHPDRILIDGDNLSPNLQIMPATAELIDDHLHIGGCDTVELAKKFGTPLWIMDEETIIKAIQALKDGLIDYPETKVFYAGKAFLCLAMCHILKKYGVGVDVVSAGELHTAVKANMHPDNILLHGNNKSPEELETALKLNGVRIVVDNEQELAFIAALAAKHNIQAKIFLRIIPGVTGKTHKHIQTGQDQSKFGMAMSRLPHLLTFIKTHSQSLSLLGLHAHIGSQIHDMQPYEQMIAVLADCYASIKSGHGIELPEINLGGGLGITYTSKDKALDISSWSRRMAETLRQQFSQRQLLLPVLLLEPGRALVGTAGVTIYRAGYEKQAADGTHYVGVDGGMADNPRPVTYQASYTAGVANRMQTGKSDKTVTLAGKYCEQGDIIIKDSLIAPKTGDLVAVFDTGAYNYSMASNYNRTGRPACVLVANGHAEIIIERETETDLLAKDRVPDRLLEKR